jgi:hypothetical protein
MSETFSQRWLVLVPDRVFLSVGAGHFSSEFIRHFDEEFVGMIEASPASRVHLITDSRQVLSLPSMNDLMKNTYPNHPRMGYNITIGAFQNPMMRMIMSFTTQVTNARYRDVRTLMEACAYIAHHDSSLPPIEEWDLPSEDEMKP